MPLPRYPLLRPGPGQKASGWAQMVRLGLALLTAAWLQAAGLGPEGSPQKDAEAQTARRQVEIVLDSEPRTTLKADEIQLDQAAGRADFSGRVSLARADGHISASRGRWHEATKTVELSGEVIMTTEEFTVRAERVILNLEHNLAKIYDGRAFFLRRNYYLAGELMERRGAETIHLKKGRVTTCDGPEPSWSVDVKDLTVTKDGYAIGAAATFNTKYFPAFYLPFVALPVKTERQSGFLMPAVAQSTRDGQTLGWPIFWATGENHDLTLTPVWRSKRGLSLTMEANHKGMASESSWLFTHLNDNKPQHYTFKRNGEERGFSDRWWLRGKSDLSAYGWDFMMDVDLASDPLFLEAFHGDPDGFTYSERLMQNTFGRGLNEAKDPLRKSVALARRNRDDSLLSLGLQYSDNLANPNNEDTLQRYPSFLYSLAGRPAGRDGHLGFFSFTSQYDYFYRHYNEHSSTNGRGHRFRLAPELYKPFNLGRWGAFTAKGGIKETLYLPQGYAADFPGGQGRRYDYGRTAQNTALEFDLGLSSTFSRVYHQSFWGAEAFRHQITPELKFTYSQNHRSDYTPFWDEFDFTPNRRTLKYGFTSTVMAKVPQVAANGGPEKIKNSGGGPVEPLYDYQEWLRVSVAASYEFSHEQELIGWPYAANYYGHGQGPAELELEINPSRNLRLLARSAYDYNNGSFVSHDFKGTVYNARGDALFVDYEQAKSGYNNLPYAVEKANEELRVGLAVKLNDEWSARFNTRYDLLNNRELETNYRLRYSAQCWGVSLAYSDTFDDSKVVVALDLLGLGSLGSGNDE